MKPHPRTLPLTALAAVLALGLAAAPASAQAPGMPATPGFESKPVLTTAVTGDDTKEIVMIAVSIAPGGYSPPHVHPGDCVGTVIQGTVDLVVAGGEPRKIASGGTFANPRGTVHQFRNSADSPVRMVTTIVVDKGKPRTQPPPQ